MAYSRPLGQMVFNGRSPGAIEEDRKRLVALHEYVALAPLERRVESYLKDKCRDELRHAFAVPDDHAPDSSSGDGGGTEDPVMVAVRAELRDAGAALASVDSATIKTEAVHAQSEIVRSWINLLCEARVLSGSRTIALDDLLIPKSAEIPEGAQLDWREACEEAKLSLNENLALTEQDIEAVHADFASRVSRSITTRSLPLPQSMSLRLGNFVFDLLDQPENAVGWRLHLVVDRKGVVSFSTAAVHIDEQGTPSPAPEMSTPCGERGTRAVSPCNPGRALP